jgi:hypothetical protein
MINKTDDEYIEEHINEFDDEEKSVNDQIKNH